MQVEKKIARGGFGLVEQVRMPDGAKWAKKTFSPAMPLSSIELEKLKKRFAREVNSTLSDLISIQC
jgi:hypothetical protein